MTAPGIAVNGRGAPLAGAVRLMTVVFVSGVGSLATEICASRLLAPYFGTSTVVWANIIGLILVYLAAGYWLGGRVADRHPEARRLGAILVVAALAVAALPFIAHPILDAAVGRLDTASVGAAVGSFLTVLALFSVPVTLLGTVAPFALRLRLRDTSEAGRVAGRLYALSTFGGLVGTFVPALLTIPLVGTQRTLLGAAAALAGAGCLLLRPAWWIVAAGCAALLAIPPASIKGSTGVLFARESAYQYVVVRQEADGARILQINEGVSVHSVWRAGTVLTGGEWDMFLTVPPLLGRPVRSVLVIGNAGGTTARAYGRFYPDARIDGVEIDPVVNEAGRRYLGLEDNPRLNVITADGRAFLHGTTRRYDVIIVDAYHETYIPFYLATEEFFTLARQHLTPGGVLALNVERVPGDRSLAATVEGTMAAAFPDTFRWSPLRFSEMAFAVNATTPESALRARAEEIPADIAILGSMLDQGMTRVPASSDPMTDDRAPVEWLTDRAIIEWIAGGGRLVEHLLPTAP